MEEIIKYCLKINGLEYYNPVIVGSQPSETNSEDYMKNKYSVIDKIIGFVTEDGSYYVSPYYIEIEKKLKELGFKEGGVFIPFTNGYIPKDGEILKKWFELCENAKKRYSRLRKEERKEKLGKLAKAKNLTSLPNEVYDMSLEIPDYGIKTFSLSQENKNDLVLYEWQIPECMGTYSIESKKLIFVDTSGTLYISPFYEKLIPILINAGYKERILIVPLAHDEVPIDKDYREKWENLCKAHQELNEQNKKKQA